MNSLLKKIIHFVLAAVIGYYLSVYLQWDSVKRIILFMIIFVVVGVTIETIEKEFTRKK